MNPLRTGVALLGVAVFAGCVIPTSAPDAPKVDQSWIAPMESATIPVGDLLPDGMTSAGDLFGVIIEPFVANDSLGALCAACVQGATGPVPAFDGTFTASQPFPAAVSAATLAGGSVVVAVHNGFSFDPVAGGGSVVMTITDGPGGKELGSATISTALAPGSTVVRAIALIEGPVSPNLAAVVALSSPGGQIATVDLGQMLVVDVDPETVLASAAFADLADQTATIAPVELDVSDIGTSISDHIQDGVIQLDILNPLHVGMTVQLDIEYPDGTLTRTVTIERSAISSVTVPYSGDDFRSFLGKDGVVLTGIGSVTDAPTPTLIRPGELLLMNTSVHLSLVIG